MVTAAQLRKIALALPEVEEKSHFGKPDFRVRNKIFGGLSADGRQATLKIVSKLQSALVQARPGTFSFAAGAWGRSGWTHVELAQAQKKELAELVVGAWRLIAPKTLVAQYDAAQAESPP
jgi:hypothetical protein